jgi:lycopene beta-cyclase
VEQHKRLVIAGGGLAGCLTALAFATARPDVRLLLVEQGSSFGGNHICSFFADDVAEADRWLVEPMIAGQWPGYDVRFPARRRSLPTGYHSLRSDWLDQQVRERLHPAQYRLGAEIASVEPKAVLLAGGERIEADAVIDARGPGPAEALDLGWQKFVGREYRLAAPHGLERPIVMDACVDQAEGYRFVYCLPFAPDRLLIEDTYYATGAELDREAIGRRIEDYAADQGWRLAELEREETGVLPVAMGGDFDAFWPAGEKVARIGLRGGFFHPTTGYSLPDAVRTAMLLARQRDFGSLAPLLRAEAARLWRERRFYRLLNRMLFRAAAAERRYRVLEHFYRLPEALIARFYAGRLTAFDKLRILSGRPPVPVGRALHALRGRRA